jgi:hypothetical protein
MFPSTNHSECRALCVNLPRYASNPNTAICSRQERTSSVKSRINHHLHSSTLQPASETGYLNMMASLSELRMSDPPDQDKETRRKGS